MKLLNHVWLFVTPWTVAYHSSVHGILQARILEWVVISFSRRSSQPRHWIQVSCIVGRHFTVWATREVHKQTYLSSNGQMIQPPDGKSCLLEVTSLETNINSNYLFLTCKYSTEIISVWNYKVLMHNFIQEKSERKRSLFYSIWSQSCPVVQNDHEKHIATDIP